MSAIYPHHETSDQTDQSDIVQSLDPTKRLLGMLVVIAVLLLAIVLRAL